MPYLVKDKNGSEWIFYEKPKRSIEDWRLNEKCTLKDVILLPSGSIKKLIGRELTWEEDAVKL